MRIIINLILLVAIVLLGYLTYASIKAPISFKDELDRRESAVIRKLNEIRRAQNVYRDVTGGSFADSWDKLLDTLKEGELMFIRIVGDPDDPDFDADNIERDTSFMPALDTIIGMGINLDSLPIIPFSGGEAFDIDADTLTYQSTLVNVVEVGTEYSKFMGRYADPAYGRYDKNYDPKKKIKFGDMKRPTTAGSWDR